MTEISPPARNASIAGWWALLILTVVTLFAVLDRQVFLLLAEPIRLRLVLSDVQLGLLQGTGVTLFAALASYPIALLADRFDRRVVLAGCLVVWSMSVAACGLATNFGQLFFASAMVGAGEAGLTPIIFSLIPDMFRGPRRQLANSLFALATAGGNSLAMILCGQLIAAVERHHAAFPLPFGAMDGWRLSFFAAAAPAPLMILLVATIVRPKTRTKVVQQEAAPVEGEETVLGYASRNRWTFGGLFASIILSAVGLGGVGTWIVVICMRMYGQTAAQVGGGIGLASLAALPMGFILSIALTRAFSGRVGLALPIRMGWIAFLVSTSLYVSLLFTTSAAQIYLIWFFVVLSGVTAGMVMPTAIQGLAPPHLRARVLSIQNIVTFGSGAIAAPLVGLVSGQLKGYSNGLLLAAVAIAVPFALAAAGVLRWVEPHYAETAERAAKAD